MNPISIVENIDCMEAMKEFPDKYFDLAIVDPPYGIDINSSGTHFKLKYEVKEWDKSSPPKEYFTQLFRVSKNQIIWGANYFINECGKFKTFIIWDKKIAESMSFAMCEMAWTSFLNGAKIYSQNANQFDRFHPTQKPIALYEWLLKNYAKQGDKILDTHLGSQSSRIAAYKMGFDFWGYEIDEDYFKQGNERFEKSIAMPLFDGVALPIQLTI